MLPDLNGIEILRFSRERWPQMDVIMVTAHASLENSIEALRLGAYDYITKPFYPDTVCSTVKRALEKQGLARERKQAEEALQRLSRRLALLNRAAQVFSSTLDLDQVLVTILEAVRHLLNVDVSSIWLIEPGTDEVVCLQATGTQCDVVRGWHLPVGVGLVGQVALSGESSIIPNAQADERHFTGVDEQTGLTLRSMISVPLRVKQKVTGILQVADEKAGQFESTDLRFLESLAASAAGAIENARLYEETDRLRAFNENIVQSMDEGILLTDAEGHITFANRSAVDMLGYDREDLLGQHRKLVVMPEEAVGVEKKTVAWSRGMSSRYETVLLTKEARRVPVIVDARPLFDDERLDSVLSVFTDITERKRSEEALRQAKDAAEAANRAKSEFLARMSHEVRTPIHAVLGMVDLTLDTTLTQEQLGYLNVLKASADSLMEIVNDILDFAKIEAGRMDLEETDFDLRAVAEQVVNMLATRAHRKELELVYYIPPQVPTALVGDSGRLRQVLLNLIGNAIKFTQHGEVVFRVDMEQEQKDSVELYFTVRDTGVGIPVDKLDVIFEPFGQADGSTTREYGGTGLGLAISRQLVELMGGRIWVESCLGEGSKFCFKVTLKMQSEEQRAAGRIEIAADWKGERVLIIDGNATNRFVLREMLACWGFEVTDVENSSTGLRELERAQQTMTLFRLVLLDCRMPGKTAPAVVQEIQAAGVPTNCIVPMVYSGQVHHDAYCRRELGLSVCLIKPVGQSKLFDAVTKALTGERKDESERSLSAGTEGVGLRILLAEDNAAAQFVGKRTLEKGGYEVRVACNGVQVLQMLENETFDLVLMDVEMPQMDGLEATRAIRAREAGSGRHIPILAVTAYASKEDRRRCAEAGTDGYLPKPVGPTKLRAALARFLSPDRDAVAAPPVDLKVALEATDGDRDLLREGVELFLERDYPRHLQTLEEGLERRDARAVKAAAHGLKGVVGSFGGQAVRDVALRLEAMAQSDDLDDALGTLDALKTEMERFAAFFTRSGWNESHISGDSDGI